MLRRSLCSRYSPRRCHLSGMPTLRGAELGSGSASPLPQPRQSAAPPAVTAGVGGPPRSAVTHRRQGSRAGLFWVPVISCLYTVISAPALRAVQGEAPDAGAPPFPGLPLGHGGERGRAAAALPQGGGRCRPPAHVTSPVGGGGRREERWPPLPGGSEERSGPLPPCQSPAGPGEPPAGAESLRLWGEWREGGREQGQRRPGAEGQGKGTGEGALPAAKQRAPRGSSSPPRPAPSRSGGATGDSPGRGINGRGGRVGLAPSRPGAGWRAAEPGAAAAPGRLRPGQPLGLRQRCVRRADRALFCGWWGHLTGDKTARGVPQARPGIAVSSAPGGGGAFCTLVSLLLLTQKGRYELDLSAQSGI